MSDNNDWIVACTNVSNLTVKLKRKPRILITKLGQDGHDRGANVVAASLSDAGFEVYQLPMFQPIHKIVKSANQFNVDIVGVSSLAGAHNELLPKLISMLEEQPKKFKVVVGGVIPQVHIETLHSYGVSSIFGPGDSITMIINELLNFFKD